MIPVRLNLALVALVVAAQVVLLAALPVLVLSEDPAWAWLLVPLVLLTVPHWALIHEAVHGHLFPHRAANETAGRLLAILFGAPLDVLRFGHLSHHALNGEAVERPEFFDPAHMPYPAAALAYFSRLAGGLYLVELASSAAAWLPRRQLAKIVRHLFHDGEMEAGGMAALAERRLLAPRTLARIRGDGAVALAVLAAGLWLWGEAWPLLVAALAGRALLVSFLDNAPHYLGELGNPRQGHDMHLPRVAATLILNANLHGTHHRHPTLPWTELPRRLAADRVPSAGNWLAVPWRQLRGPVPLHRRRG